MGCEGKLQLHLLVFASPLYDDIIPPALEPLQ
jgi:hypothetical protein